MSNLTYIVNVEGVLYRELLSEWVENLSIVGTLLFFVLHKSFLIITIATPAGPAFFCAPANNIPTFFQSIGYEKT